MDDAIKAQVGRLPFEEAQKYIQDKLLIPSKQWTDLMGGIHAKAFTVAGATTLSLLEDLYSAVQNSILDGTTLSDFRRDFDAVVQRHGWSYKGKRGWRTRVIFETNKRSAYMAGRWEQAWRLRHRRPFMQYITADDDRVREEHSRWHLIVLPIEHGFWDINYPPNGWRCRCFVRTLSQAQIDSDSLQIADIPAPQPRIVTNLDTGESIARFEGVDHGWDYNVGKAWQAPDEILGQQLLDVPQKMRAKALDWMDNVTYDRPYKKFVNDVSAQVLTRQNPVNGYAQSIGFMRNDVIDALYSRGFAPANASFTVRDSDVANWVRNISLTDSAVPISIIQTLPAIIRNPDAVLLNFNQLIYARRLADGRYATFTAEIKPKRGPQIKTNFKALLNHVLTASISTPDELAAFQLLTGDIN